MVRLAAAAAGRHAPRRRGGVRRRRARAEPLPVRRGVLDLEVATQNSATAVLATLGSIVALWLVTGIVDAGGVWRSDRTRMDFLRFSGEWLVYFVLIAIVGGR